MEMNQWLTEENILYYFACLEKAVSTVEPEDEPSLQYPQLWTANGGQCETTESNLSSITDGLPLLSGSKNVLRIRLFSYCPFHEKLFIIGLDVAHASQGLG